MARATPTQEKPKAAKKAAAKPKATKPKATKADGEKATRRPGGERGWLATEIDKTLRKEGGSMTVADIASRVTNAHGEHPSSGAVAAALVRWAEQGYIEVTADRPMSFKKFTAKYGKKDLTAFLEDQRAARQAERDAKKAAKAKS